MCKFGCKRLGLVFRLGALSFHYYYYYYYSSDGVAVSLTLWLCDGVTDVQQAAQTESRCLAALPVLAGPLSGMECAARPTPM